MKKINHVMENYREAVRHLWRTAFYPYADIYPLSNYTRFTEITYLMFHALVTERLFEGKNMPPSKYEFPFIIIKINSEYGCPIMISRDREALSGSWDHEIERVENTCSEFEFISYFDWDEFDYLDYRYFLVKIKKFPQAPYIEGHQALIETQYASAYFADDLVAFNKK